MAGAVLKRWLWRLLGKEEAAVVVSFLSGPWEPARAMLEEVRRLMPERRHFAVTLVDLPPLEGVATIRLAPASAWRLASQLRGALRRYRIGMAPVLFTRGGAGAGGGDTRLRRAAFLLAPTKILAYNQHLERHHLRLRCAVASGLFLRGVPLDRIWLRPGWLWPWRRERSVYPTAPVLLAGRPCHPSRRRVAVVSPYFPYPLSHGGAVRIFHLLREAAKHFDVFLFCFHEPGQLEETGPVMELCARAVLFPMPRYREPRWSTWRPPEVCEFRAPALAEWLEGYRREFDIGLVQVEYTYMATSPGDILVEHDVTFDLYRQMHRRRRTLGSLANWLRWALFERAAVRRYRRVVTMSDKDARLLGVPHAVAIPNGVDLERFRPVAERAGRRLLFVGSFRHLPNIVAFRFLTEEVWPHISAGDPDLELSVVAGPDPELYWRASNQPGEPLRDARVHLHAFVRDVRPHYEETNLVLVPTLESAGTNLKVLEAMAMERAVVSTPSGCDGLGLEHGRSVWVAASAHEFAQAVRTLLDDPERRAAIARAARLHAERHFDWTVLGERQRALWSELFEGAASRP